MKYQVTAYGFYGSYLIDHTQVVDCNDPLVAIAVCQATIRLILEDIHADLTKISFDATLISDERNGGSVNG